MTDKSKNPRKPAAEGFSCQTSSIDEINWQLSDDEFDYLNWYSPIDYDIIRAIDQINNGEFETHEQVFDGYKT